MNYWKIELGDAILPKYAYFCNAFADIYKRVDRSFPAIYNTCEDLPPTRVLLYVCKLETEEYPIALDDFTGNMLKPDFGKRLDVQEFLEQSIEPQTFNVLILSESLKSQLRRKLMRNNNIILIKVDGKKQFNLKKQRLSTTIGTVFSDTDSALEEVITSIVAPMYRKLFELHRPNVKQLSVDDNSHVRAADCMELCDEMDPPPKIKRIHAKHNGTTDELSQLVAELGALLDKSGDHHTEKADKPYNKEITKELCDALKAACPSVKRIGYIFDTLEIQAVFHKENKAKIQEKIRVALKKFNILDFEITECLEQIQFFTWIGSKIEAGKEFGTLGCILQDATRNEQYGAVSKHVVQSEETVNLNTGRHIIPGTVVRATAKHEYGSMDIAAIQLTEKADENNRKFKNSSGGELRGQLNDSFIREGGHVHIYGATSSPNPGRGVISCPRMKDYETRYPLITIKDAYNSKFASRGDSGAIVCADDPSGRNVFALGMVMGTLDRAGKTYAALPLSEGIQQLSRITGNELELM